MEPKLSFGDCAEFAELKQIVYMNHFLNIKLEVGIKEQIKSVMPGPEKFLSFEQRHGKA